MDTISKEILEQYAPRGFIVEENDRYLGIDIMYNIYAYGKNPKDTYKKLQRLIAQYIKDAIKNKEIKEFIPRKAPLSFCFQYYKIRFMCCSKCILFHTLIRIFHSIKFLHECQVYRKSKIYSFCK